MIAATAGRTDILKVLKEQGADTQLKDRSDMTALDLAYYSSLDPGSVKLLFDWGCDKEAHGWKGMTPLMTAVLDDSYNSFDTARQLLESGADVNDIIRSTSKDWTALDLARVIGNKDMIDLLKRYGASDWNS